MLKINKKAEPEFFKKFKIRYKYKNWNDYNSDAGKEIKEKLKENMLEKEQDWYCPYCERKISSIGKSHIEHIVPRNTAPDIFQDYFNFLTCCMSKETCGMKKGNEYSENFINPVLENPEEYFEYDIKTGKIKIKPNSKAKMIKAEETIRILNLNNERLKDQRYEILKQMEMMKDSGCLSIFEDGNFPTLVKYFIENHK